MFAKQFQYIKLLTEILKSKGIIEGDDLPAFFSVSRADQERNAHLLRVVKAQYRKNAKEIGLTVRFPKERTKH